MKRSYIYNHKPQSLEEAIGLIRDLRYCLKNGTRHLVYAKSGYRGVYRHRAANCELKRPWKAYYRQHGQYNCIGYYATAEEAALAYNKAVMHLTNPALPLNDIVTFPPLS